MAIDTKQALLMSEEEIQEKVTEASFEMIANVGTARGLYIEAIQEAKRGNYENAAKLVEEGKQVFVEGHHAHADILEMQSAGVKLPMNIFLMHAEDQMLVAEGFETIANELIDVYKKMDMR